jgi:hypothetical protein
MVLRVIGGPTIILIAIVLKTWILQFSIFVIFLIVFVLNKFTILLIVNLYKALFKAFPIAKKSILLVQIA